MPGLEPNSNSGGKEAPCRTCTDFKSWAKKQNVIFGSNAGDPSAGGRTSKKTTSTEKNDTRGCPYDEDDLGRSTWGFLHTMAANYPDLPSKEEITNMSTFFSIFAKIYPCDMCAKDFQKELVNEPIQASSQQSLSQWLCRYAVYYRTNVSKHSLKLISRNAKLNSQYSILKDHADVVQADVRSVLQKASAQGKKHEIAQLWISNELIVRNIDKETVEMLRVHPDVASLTAEWFIQLDDVMEVPYIAPRNNTIFSNQWGVDNVGAPQVWDAGNKGIGAVVGVIDTGARATHIALRYTYRGNQPGQNHNYNWLAPTGQDAVPSDNNGHGTHVIGSASGTEGIGVAPGSSWIACRGCTTAGCSDFNLLECGNWMACPTNTVGASPDCSKAPNVVNNSWGGGSNNPWYDAIITAWRNVDIVPIFSAGNAGFDCRTLISPGDRPLAISVGATLANNQRSGLSSIGPTVNGRINPFIVAPGNDIYSASHLDDTSYNALSGSSMAAPHISGVVALLISRNRSLTVSQITAALRGGAIPHAPVGATCGGIPDNTFPNNHVGYGRIWAPAAMNSVPQLH